jgi:hypothetical protein
MECAVERLERGGGGEVTGVLTGRGTSGKGEDIVCTSEGEVEES